MIAMTSRQSYPAMLDAAWAAHLAEKSVDAPTVVSTFAGAGGSSLGYSMAGFRELLAVEWEDHAAEMLRRNLHGVPVFHGDIATVTADAIPLAPGELDVLDGSPPCQGFSLANGSYSSVKADPRNQLFMEFARLLGIWSPKVFVMENVANMAAGRNVGIFKTAMRMLTQSGKGYRLRAKVVLASRLGVPQRRRRLIVIGTRSDLDIEPVHPEPLMTPEITVRQAFEGIENTGLSFILSGSRDVSLIPYTRPGEYLSAVVERMGGKKVTGFTCSRADYDRASATLIKSGPPNSGIIHPRENRFLTSAELCRLQSFPDQYDWGSSTYREIHARLGNSVPPLMSREIASAIRHGVLERLQ